MTEKRCNTCKHWGVNRDAILNGIENATRDNNSYCESKDIRGLVRIQETALPDYIVPSIKFDFISHWSFNCIYWEEYPEWEKLWG